MASFPAVDPAQLDQNLQVITTVLTAPATIAQLKCGLVLLAFSAMRGNSERSRERSASRSAGPSPRSTTGCSASRPPRPPVTSSSSSAFLPSSRRTAVAFASAAVRAAHSSASAFSTSAACPSWSLRALFRTADFRLARTLREHARARLDAAHRVHCFRGPRGCRPARAAVPLGARDVARRAIGGLAVLRSGACRRADSLRREMLRGIRGRSRRALRGASRLRGASSLLVRTARASRLPSSSSPTASTPTSALLGAGRSLSLFRMRCLDVLTLPLLSRPHRVQRAGLVLRPEEGHPNYKFTF